MAGAGARRARQPQLDIRDGSFEIDDDDVIDENSDDIRDDFRDDFRDGRDADKSLLSLDDGDVTIIEDVHSDDRRQFFRVPSPKQVRVRILQIDPPVRVVQPDTMYPQLNMLPGTTTGKNKIVKPEEPKSIAWRLFDVSGGGVGFVAGAREIPSTRAKLRLQIEWMFGLHIDVEALVRRIDPIPDVMGIFSKEPERYVVGVMFSGINERHRDLLIAHLLREQAWKLAIEKRLSDDV